MNTVRHEFSKEKFKKLKKTFAQEKLRFNRESLIEGMVNSVKETLVTATNKKIAELELPASLWLILEIIQLKELFKNSAGKKTPLNSSLI